METSPLIIGSTGISGAAIAELYGARGQDVYGLARRTSALPNVTSLSADLLDVDSLNKVLADVNADRVFITAWVRGANEQENIEINSAIVRNVLAAASINGTIKHVALMTGLKHYLGPFEAYGQGLIPETPFRESEPRLDAPNFYYAQEDELFAAAEQHGFTWSVHRSHSIVGHAIGNTMNMALTIAAQASICKELGLPFVFPGSEAQWNGLTDVTDAGLLAEQMVWASETPAAANNAFNTVNGDVFRWRWMWSEIAEYFGVEAVGFEGEPRPLEQQMVEHEKGWPAIAERHGLAEANIDRLASWWHTDADLGRNIECLADVSKSRKLGFTGYRSSLDSFTAQFDRYRREQLIP